MNTLDQHIDQLCSRYSVRRIVKPGRGRARVSSRVIRHPPVRGDVMAYWVALHELGHCEVGLEGKRLEREARAWEWALEHAIIPAHYSVRQRICACLVRYLHRARAHGWAIPADEDGFWQLLTWWQPLREQVDQFQ